MKKMKKVGIVFVAMMMILSVSMAQKGKSNKGGMTPEQRATRQTSVLTKRLLLTAEQQTKVKQIIQEKIINLDQVKEKYQGNKSKERNGELKALRLAFQQDMKSVLTPEQYEKWHKMRVEKAEKAKAKKVKTAKPSQEEETEDIF